MRVPFLLVVIAFLLLSWQVDHAWKTGRNKLFDIYYTAADKKVKKRYEECIRIGLATTEHFFNSHYPAKFEVYVYPDRRSLDSTWQKEWKMPEFKSECWMVASGVAKRLDLLSPRLWDTQACEHRSSDKTEMQKIITHELVHVFHAQQNPDPDFSEVSGIDWFVEGLATYVSGQLDSTRVQQVKEAIAMDKIPKSLEQFWSGKLKYGLSGSVVAFIDKKYGTSMLFRLLKISNLQGLLHSLGTTEGAFIAAWKDSQG
jgi:hypothetical protein